MKNNDLESFFADPNVTTCRNDTNVANTKLPSLKWPFLASSFFIKDRKNGGKKSIYRHWANAQCRRQTWKRQNKWRVFTKSSKKHKTYCEKLHCEWWLEIHIHFRQGLIWQVSELNNKIVSIYVSSVYKLGKEMLWYFQENLWRT